MLLICGCRKPTENSFKILFGLSTLKWGFSLCWNYVIEIDILIVFDYGKLTKWYPADMLWNVNKFCGIGVCWNGAEPSWKLGWWREIREKNFAKQNHTKIRIQEKLKAPKKVNYRLKLPHIPTKIDQRENVP